MKSKLLLSALLAAASALSAAPLVMPKTSESTIASAPLKQGEIAYEEIEGDAVALRVGDGGQVKRVVDPSAVRGYELGDVPRGEMAISWDPGITYSASKDKWTFPDTLEVTNRIIVTCAAGVQIANVTYQTINEIPGCAGEVPCGAVGCDVMGNVAIVWGTMAESGDLAVSNINVCAVVNGKRETVNDLTKLHVATVDSIGESELGQWREWARAQHAGNRGEDWAKYPAAATVKLKNNAVVHGDNFAWAMTSTTNLMLTASGRSLMDVHGNGVRSTNGLVIASIKNTNSNYVYVTVVNTIEAFDDQYLIVEHCNNMFDGLGNFVGLVRGRDYLWDTVWTDGVTTTNKITVLPRAFNPFDTNFLRVHYMSDVTDPFRIEFNCNVHVNEHLFLKGEDGQLYVIRVQPGGTLTATAINN